MNPLQVTSWSNNKILFTSDLLKWLSIFNSAKDTLVITPLTRLSDLLKLKAGSELGNELINAAPEGLAKFVNTGLISALCADLNARLGADLLLSDLAPDKVLKALFELAEDVPLSAELIARALRLINKHALKMLTVVVAGFNNLPREHLNMVTVHVLTPSLVNLVHYHNLEELVMLDYEGLNEVVDRDKFLTWLELKTRTVLTPEDINTYLRGGSNYNSFLIAQALSELK